MQHGVLGCGWSRTVSDSPLSFNWMCDWRRPHIHATPMGTSPLSQIPFSLLTVTDVLLRWLRPLSRHCCKCWHGAALEPARANESRANF